MDLTFFATLVQLGTVVGLCPARAEVVPAFAGEGIGASILGTNPWSRIRVIAGEFSHHRDYEDRWRR